MSTRSTTAAANGALAARRGRGHKERSKNFTELEKRTVLELIARHRDVLRQGRSNNATNKNKALVWSTICSEVNSRCGADRPRTPAQVKMWYENYKKKCKMRAVEHQPQESTSFLDGSLWSVNPLEIKEDEPEESCSVNSHREDDCLPVNMSNGRLSSCHSSEDAMPGLLEPQVQITPHSPPPAPCAAPCAAPAAPARQCVPAPIQSLHNHLVMSPLSDYRKFVTDSPLNLSHLEDGRPDRQTRERAERRRADPRDAGATEEERLYYTAKRQHAITEHEAKMRILNMELRQKEEIFTLQKQLFLIELKLKMDFLEKACSK